MPTVNRQLCSFTTFLFTGLLCASAFVPSGAVLAENTQKSPYQLVMAAEAKSKALCETDPNRIFVKIGNGSECIAYFATYGGERQHEAVVFLDGDMSADKYRDPARIASELASTRKSLQQWADKLKVRYVYVSRVGLNGSSGNHGARRDPHETHIMNAAIDILKMRLGLDRIALAGQSGGSTISASLLSLGRTDVSCAVLGSGAFEVVDIYHKILTANGTKISRSKLELRMYDPAAHVDEVPADPKRRIIVIGDTTDTRTPFDQQVRYVNNLRERGHHAILVPVEAGGELDHGAAIYTIPTAGGCLKGTPDDRLIKANDGLVKRVQQRERTADSTDEPGNATVLKAVHQATASSSK